ncbi:MAG: biotin/lipoyl-containing protein [Candidatus Methanofastidiosia archaeon]
MKLLVSLEGEDFSVEVEDDDGKLSIVVSDKLFKIDKGEGFLVVNGERFKGELLREENGYLLRVGGEEHPVKFREVLEKKARGEEVILEKGLITAPMPGKIVEVNTKVGDKVKSGDVLGILEAMKMENEITSTKSGIVKKLNMQKGESVSKGDVLVVVE